MKYLIASDIHGSEESAKIVIDKFEKLNADKIILLGDILYHGPRNDLPEHYNPKKVFEILNKYADKIIAVRGNCDAEVDQMVLKFTLYDNYEFCENGIDYFLTHGHKISAESPANLKKGTVVLHGHTHIYQKADVNSVTYLNIGSITIPKENTKRCYAVLNETGVKLFDLNDKAINF